MCTKQAGIYVEKEERPPRWGSERRSLIRPKSSTMLRILGMFRVTVQDGIIEIVAGIDEMNAELSRILKVVRFDPAFM